MIFSAHQMESSKDKAPEAGLLPPNHQDKVWCSYYLQPPIKASFSFFSIL